MNKFELGENIRKRRKYIGENQEEIASRIPVSKSQISKWENENSCPYLSDFEKLAEAMNIHPVDLITGRIEEDWIKHKEKKEKIRVWTVRLLIVMIICLSVSAFVLIYRLIHFERIFPNQYNSNLLYSRPLNDGITEIRQMIKSKEDDVWVDIVTYQRDGVILDYKLNEIVFTGHQTESKHKFVLGDEGEYLLVYVSYMDESENKMSLVEVTPLK